MTPPTAALPIARFLALVKEAHGQLDPMTMTQAVEIADAAIEAKCELFAACAPAVQATADADGAIRAAEDICAYLMHECGHDTDNTDRAMIAGYISKHLSNAVSPKAADGPIHAMRDMWLSFPGLGIGSLSTLCIQEMSPEQAGFYALACEAAKSAASPPAVSGDKQEKERG